MQIGKIKMLGKRLEIPYEAALKLLDEPEEASRYLLQKDLIRLRIAKEVWDIAVEKTFYPPIPDPIFIFDRERLTGFYIDHRKWQIYLNLSNSPSNIDEELLFDYYFALTIHEIGHYTLCPYDGLTNARLLAAALKGTSTEFAPVILNIFADLIVDYKCYIRFPKEMYNQTVITYRMITDMNRRMNTPPGFTFKFINRCYELMWNVKISEEIYTDVDKVARKAVNLIMKDIFDEKTWTKKVEKLARLLTPYLTEEQREAVNNIDRMMESFGEAGGSNTGVNTGTTDGPYPGGGGAGQLSGDSASANNDTRNMLRTIIRLLENLRDNLREFGENMRRGGGSISPRSNDRNGTDTGTNERTTEVSVTGTDRSEEDNKNGGTGGEFDDTEGRATPPSDIPENIRYIDQPNGIIKPIRPEDKKPILKPDAYTILGDPKEINVLPTRIRENREKVTEREIADVINIVNTEIAEQIASETDYQTFCEVNKIMNLVPSDEELITYYRGLSNNMIKIEVKIRKQGGMIPVSVEPWRLGDPIDELDPFLSLQGGPRLIPNITTRKWVKKLGEGISTLKDIPDLLIVIDSSNSMNWKYGHGGRDDRFHTALISAFSAYRYAVARGAKVAVINFSGRGMVKTVPWTRDGKKIEKALIKYYDDGTSVPIDKIEEMLKKAETRVLILLITDFEIDNWEELVEKLGGFLRAGHKIVGFLIGTGINEVNKEEMEGMGVKLYPVKNPDDLIGLVISEIKESY